MQETQILSLDVNLVQAIYNYLGTRPYAEVNALVKAIEQTAQQQGKIEDAPVEPVAETQAE